MGERRRHGRRPQAGRSGDLLRRHRDTALAHGRGPARLRGLHRARRVRDARPRLARRGPRRPPRPPHDRAHRLPPHRPPAGTGSGAPAAQTTPLEVRLQRCRRRGLDARRTRRAVGQRQEAAQDGTPGPDGGGGRVRGDRGRRRHHRRSRRRRHVDRFRPGLSIVEGSDHPR
ncbi:hypothetical protein FRIGORI9N_310255 [Frigoribacterium sp. 9N]|nr:hypothetical protein FRIGORI9N_310255 [Frigoribacterium sp. 9N]